MVLFKIVIIILVLLISLLIFKIIKHTIKLIIALLLILILFISLFAVLSHLELNTFNDEIASSNNLIVYPQNDTLKAFSIFGFDRDSVVNINADNILSEINNQEYNLLLKKYSKIIIFHEKIELDHFFESGSTEIINKYYQGEVLIYPETLSMRLIKKIKGGSK